MFQVKHGWTVAFKAQKNEQRQNASRSYSGQAGVAPRVPANECRQHEFLIRHTRRRKRSFPWVDRPLPSRSSLRSGNRLECDMLQ